MDPSPGGASADDSAFDDEVALSADDQGDQALGSPAILPAGQLVIPFGRLAVADLFRPPIAAAI